MRVGKKMKKKTLLANLLVGLSLLLFTTPASAEETEQVINSEKEVPSINIDGDLQHSESPVYSNDGIYLGKIVIDEIPSLQSRGLIHSEVAKNKNYNIHFIGVTANVGFGITVKNKNITRAYNAWSNGLIWDVSTNKLTRTNKETRLPGRASFGFKGWGFNTSFRLRAVISGNNLQTHLDIP
ncbi:DUF5626 family protein [Enterococcus quebecensis]|uniref:DUF5626 domain-containing protein n=1 Tax=Enterococcus quebecensis TaxID=903983 RepID=A0A1E5H349_9ENTE|nr:DUF5626 family protein [Enterococcus quebecensis]OEG19341.1 hypothetical protein BCR23_01230 [Enterococcus quebecensis]